MEQHGSEAVSAGIDSESATASHQRLLLAALRWPWSSPSHVNTLAEISAEYAGQHIQAIIDNGWLQSASQALSSYPSTHLAPSTTGLRIAAEASGLSLQMFLKQMRFTPGRYWVLRATLEYAHELHAICDATAHDIAVGERFTSLDYDLFLPYRYKSNEVYLHAALALFTPKRAHPYFLLLDRGEAPVWQWYPQLRCLNRMARSVQVPDYFPPLLIISTRGSRASAMLVLARMASATLTVAATALRDVALEGGLLAVTREQGWRSLKSSGALAIVDPFRLPGMERVVYQRCHFAVRTLDHLCATKSARATSDTTPVPITLARPALLSGLEHLEAVPDPAYRLLTFLVRHPVMPETALSTFLDVSLDDVARDLSILQQHELAERIATPRQLDEPIWSATDMALCLRMAREMQPPSALKRYRFYRRDAERHLFHTLAVHRFFEALKKRCDGRSRATRRLDTPPGALNTGHIPYYELSVYESEVTACDWYVHNQQARHWRPDGYGALRAGATYTRFWLEMDGTPQASSRKDPAVWAGKMGRLYDYIQSRRWALRYPHVPRLLVVTTDLANRALLYDALVAAARARAMQPLLEVYLACTAALQQRGPLGQIWYRVSSGDDADRDTLSYAFEGVAPIAVHSRRSYGDISHS